MAKWFVVQNGQERGPFTDQQLRDHVAQGYLFPDDLIRRADLPTMQRAGDIKGLFAHHHPDNAAPRDPRRPVKADGFRPADYGSLMPSDGFFAGVKRLVLALFGKKPW